MLFPLEDVDDCCTSILKILTTVIVSSLAVLLIRFLCLSTRADCSKRQLYTACSSPECIRCSRYNSVRLVAAERLNNFEKIRGIPVDRLSRAATSFQQFLSESQKPNVFYLPELKRSPWWESTSFQRDVKLLERNWKSIYGEFLEVHRGDSALQMQWTANRTESGCWETFYFYNQGHEMSENCKLCPKTHQILKGLEHFMSGCIFGNALFSVLTPNTTVTEHYGPTNLRIRCHLGLSIPSGCSLTVDNETHSWTDGRCSIFDDSFIHSARHDGLNHNPRVVFLLDFWHPDLEQIEKEALLYAFGMDVL